MGGRRFGFLLGLWIKCAGLMLSAVMLCFGLSEEARLVGELPRDIYLDEAGLESLGAISGPFKLTIEENGETVSVLSGSDERLNASGVSATIELYGLPIKTVALHSRDTVMVMPGGQSVGVTMHTKGALVVGLGAVETETGSVNPAAEAGVKAGDVILKVNGKTVENAEHLVLLLNEAKERADLTVMRAGETLELSLRPALDEPDGEYRAGMWVRDSTAGIGTVSFYAMRTMRYGALGHGITDVDTGTLLSVKDGEIIRASILGVAAGAYGMPGELKGNFGSASERLGSIEQNTEIGIYGSLYQEQVNPLYPSGLPLAYPEEAELGAATLLCTVDGEGVREFSCEIMKVYEQAEPDVKGMVIRVTDPALIGITGGIVQGMSGSPVLQNGKLIGAVTHVFVNDPLKGYAMYAFWMHEQCR